MPEVEAKKAIALSAAYCQKVKIITVLPQLGIYQIADIAESVYHSKQQMHPVSSGRHTLQNPD